MTKEIVPEKLIMEHLKRNPGNISLPWLMRELTESTSETHRYNAVFSEVVMNKLKDISDKEGESLNHLVRQSLKLTMMIDCHSFVDGYSDPKTYIKVAGIPIQIDSVEDEYDLSTKARLPLELPKNEFIIGRSIAQMVELSYAQYIERASWFAVAFDEARQQAGLAIYEPLPLTIGKTSYAII